MNLIRTLLFNVLFYGSIALGSFLFIPVLFMPKKICNVCLREYFRFIAFLEKTVLGLSYEVVGREFLPKSGSYIIGAKHQSAYETLKFHVLVDNPAIILKKELLLLPVWGWIAQKMDNIAVDRKSRKSAMESILNGAKVAKSQGRPVVIFPQGTRVKVTDTPKTKRYKWGIARMAKGAELDIVPMAMNAGLFWPRNAFIKKPGKVTFEFLPPISYKLSEDNIMEKLQDVLETKSNALAAKAIKNQNLK